MLEDSVIIRLNIRHYKELLQLPRTEDARQQILKLLADAQAQLPRVLAEVSERSSGF